MYNSQTTNSKYVKENTAFLYRLASPKSSFNVSNKFCTVQPACLKIQAIPGPKCHFLPVHQSTIITFNQNFIQNCKFRFLLSKMLNSMILFVFHAELICCVYISEVVVVLESKVLAVALKNFCLHRCSLPNNHSSERLLVDQAQESK